MSLVMLLDSLVSNPDRAEAGGLGGHHIDSVTEVNRKFLDARTGELKHLVLHETALESRLDKGDGDIVRANSMLGLALKPNEDYFRSVDVPSVVEELLDKLTTTLADTHAAQGSITGVGIRSENHTAAGSEGLADILMDDGLVGGNIYATIFLGG